MMGPKSCVALHSSVKYVIKKFVTCGECYLATTGLLTNEFTKESLDAVVMGLSVEAPNVS